MKESVAKECLSPVCPKVEKALSLLTKRWTALIVHQLLQGTLRFSELEASIPELSGKMLAARLKEMEMAGMVERMKYNEIPPRVEYTLTEKGRELQPVLRQIAWWADKWL